MLVVVGDLADARKTFTELDFRGREELSRWVPSLRIKFLKRELYFC